LRTTYRIGGWFGKYLWVSIPGSFVAAAAIGVVLGDPVLTALLFVAAVVNAVTMAFLISIRTVVDPLGVEQLAFRRRTRTGWEDVSRGVLMQTKDNGNNSEVPALQLRDGTQTPFGASQVGRRPDGELETLLDRMRRELDERSISRDW
jgi:hypothetical protein